MSGKPYYPNNWEAYKEAPDEMFEPHTFEEVMSWKVAGWELPSSVCCIIRAETKGKVKEFVYQSQHAAKEKVRKSNGRRRTLNLQCAIMSLFTT
jgi:hypothetical protein